MQPTTSLNRRQIKPGIKIIKKIQYKMWYRWEYKNIPMKVDLYVTDLKKDNSLWKILV